MAASRPTTDMMSTFGSKVFSDAVMKERMSPELYVKVQEAIVGNRPIDAQTADAVAAALKAWALSHGVTCFTHWFKPFRTHAATKDVYFVALQSRPDRPRDVEPIAKFSGKMLVQGETDGSSFPNGGLRGTSFARGYVAWNPTSMPFIMYDCLYIPAIFGTMYGQATGPILHLMRSETAVVTAGKRFFELFNRLVPSQAVKNTDLRSCVGLEQEIFVVDRKLFAMRPDLFLTGRTVMGAPPALGQQLSDHYWGPLPARVRNCLKAAHARLWELGVPVTQIHNEVAPAQFELVPYHGPSVVAVEQNTMMMQVLEDVCEEHGLACLLHEKPFAAVNGSGKHVNWSIDNAFGSLYNPGPRPAENKPFMFFLAAFLRACNLHSDLLRATIACPGNEFRLGGMEAPPGIITVYTGEDLQAIIDSIVAGKKVSGILGKETLDFGVPQIPVIKRDMCDRNRTSPMAFTGNRFEFRAVGSSQDCAIPICVMNTIVAQSLHAMCDEVEALLSANTAPVVAFDKVIRDTLTVSQRIVYNGDCYSQAYRNECAKRGLVNIDTTAKALALWDSPKNRQLFSSLKVLSEVELKALSHMFRRFYVKSVEVEAKCCLDMARSLIVPAVTHFQGSLAEAINSARAIVGTSSVEQQRQLLVSVTNHLNALITSANALETAIGKALRSHGQDQAFAFNVQVGAAMLAVREHCDKLETITDGAKWPIPRYAEVMWHKLGSL
ncbi:glutamate-ammonia ligase [Pelomyxa schiedti]|nr:glutamate-ammonia ligase [Pelomyxa schiedti]